MGTIEDYHNYNYNHNEIEPGGNGGLGYAVGQIIYDAVTNKYFECIAIGKLPEEDKTGEYWRELIKDAD